MINTLTNTVAGSLSYSAGYASQASASGATVFVPDQSSSLVRVFSVNGSGVPSVLRNDGAFLATGSAALASNYAVTKQGTGDYLDINAVSNGANQHTTLIGGSAGSVFSDSNTNQYYANYSGGAKVVNAATGVLVRSLASQILAVDPAATHNFVYQIGTATVLNQLNGASNVQTGTYDFGSGASISTVAVNPSNGDVFVAIQALNKIVELTPAMTFVRQFSIASPQSIAVADGEIFVDSAGAGSLSVILIDPSTLTALDSWRERYFGAQANSGNSADTATPDHDGITNLVKYGLVITPGSSGVSSLPTAQTRSYAEGDRLALIFTRDPVRNDITLIVQGSDSLAGPWTALATSANGTAFTGVGYVSEIDAGGGLKTVEIRDTVNMSDAPHRFMRIAVTHS